MEQKKEATQEFQEQFILIRESDVRQLQEDVKDIRQRVRDIHTILPPDPDRWFSVADLCEYLPMHPVPATVYRWIKKSSIPYVEAGKYRIFRKSIIDAWLMEKSQKTIGDITAAADQYTANRKTKYKTNGE